MAVKIKSILNDPRWIEFVIRYRYNWGLFLTEQVEKPPTPQQAPIVQAMQQTGARVTVSSGHGTGKSDSCGSMFIVFMVCFPQARGVVIANSRQQARSGVFKYVHANWKRVLKNSPWLAQYFTLTDTMFYANEDKNSWQLQIKACKAGQEEGLAGEHAKHLMQVVDEASGFPDRAFQILSGALTETDNRMLMLSQPTRPSGYFYDSHHTQSITEGEGRWLPFVITSEESPLVTMDFIQDKMVEYGGVESPEYLIKVRGQFPDIVDGMLISRVDLDFSASLDIEMPDGWGWVAACDVGDGRDKSVINICQVWVGEKDTDRIVKTHKIIEMPSTVGSVKFAKVINQMCDEDIYPNITIAVDAVGIGSATIEELENLGRDPFPIDWGKTPFGDRDKKRFYNLRAKAHIMAKYAVESGRMQLDRDVKTREQGTKLPYALNEKGQYVMMSKKVMREKLNIPSPDRFDTYCFMFLTPVAPVEGVRISSEKKERRTQVEKMMEEGGDLY